MLALIFVAATGVVVVIALAAILVEVAVLAVLRVIIEKKWLDLCGGERVYVFMFPDINILNVGGALSIFMSLCRKNIK